MLKFKTLTIDDAQEINNFTKRYLPYSDFNFVSLYSWSLHSQTKFCIEDDCLYIICPDYVSQEPIYMILCDTGYVKTVTKFMEWMKHGSIDYKFSLIPLEVAYNMQAELSKEGYKVQTREDRDAFDYILDIEKTVNAIGKGYQDYRHKLFSYNKLWSDKIESIEFDPHSNNDLIMVIKLAKKWAHDKNGDYDLYKDEIDAITRFLYATKYLKNIIIKAYKYRDELVGFAACEIVSSKYAMGHFLKYDSKYKGIYYMLVNDLCQELLLHSITYINIEQDLGIENLRSAKIHLRPVSLFKKFHVEVTE